MSSFPLSNFWLERTTVGWFLPAGRRKGLNLPGNSTTFVCDAHNFPPFPGISLPTKKLSFLFKFSILPNCFECGERGEVSFFLHFACIFSTRGATTFSARNRDRATFQKLSPPTKPHSGGLSTEQTTTDLL